MHKLPLEIILAVMTLTAGFAILGCVSEHVAVDLEPPDAVQITPRSADTVYFEQGIDAVPEGDYIHLSWYPSLENDLAGYRVYRTAHLENAERILIVELDPEITEYEDHDPVLAPDQGTGLSTGFSYWVTAYDESGNESALSEEALYKLMTKPNLTEPQQQGENTSFTWTYEQLDQVDYFVVKLFRMTGGVRSPVWSATLSIFFPLEVICYEPLSDGIYQYQVDVVGAASSEWPWSTGSEMVYQFTIP
jgi:hypothetical protein